MLPAFAEVAPVYYDDVIEYTDEMIEPTNVEETDVQTVNTTQKKTKPRTTANRSTSRAISATASGTNARNNTRVAPTTIRNAQKVSRGTVSRTSKLAEETRANQRAVVARSGRLDSDKKTTTARVGAYAGSVMPVYRSSSSSDYVTTLSDSGNTLYNSNSRLGTAARRNISSRISTSAIPTSSTAVVTEAAISNTTSTLDAVAELTEYCRAQYAACMDNYCNVLDDNQGRCSCSKNIKNYQKVEEALATATENFQDTVQKIKYLGLTTEQVASLFTETEAELEMKGSYDSSQIKNSLDSIRKKIVDVSSPNASSYTATSGVSMDVSGLLNVDLSSGFDLGSFLNMGTGNASSSVSNQRGEQLYKTAMARCKTSVLNTCTAQGIDANLITNSYDLEIDKQCIAYERNLNDANAEMRDNARNATTILQQARLMLAQNRNAYDIRGCISAIDSCMQDEYVCGSDYELCLDPTGKYLADGAIVKGGTPGISGGTVKNTDALTTGTVETWTSKGMYDLYSSWNYGDSNNLKNAWGGGKKETLGEYIDEKLSNWKDNAENITQSDDMATYILQKIGYMDSKDTVHGMCASVMKQCQDYTYTSSSKTNKRYKLDNEVVRQYLASTLTKIKLQQDAILANYAEDCLSDVTSCLSTNGYNESNTSPLASRTAINACRADIQTCMSVTGQKPSDVVKLSLSSMSDWIKTILLVCPEYQYMNEGRDGTISCERCDTVTGYKMVNGSVVETSDVQLYAPSGSVGSDACVCPDGYTTYSNGCLLQ